jgi:hypothetical protein
MKATIIFIVVLLINMLALPVGGMEPFVLYDDFSSKFIDVNKWYGVTMRSGAVVLLEFTREIQKNRLHLANRTYGDTTSNKEFSRGYNVLGFLNEGRITAMKATVQINDFEAKGCKANPFPSAAGLHLAGSFFNTGTAPTPNNQQKDVIAGIGIQRRSNSTDEPNVLEVNYRVMECGDKSDRTCISPKILDQGFLGIVMNGEITDLSIRWDQANHQFIFQLNLQSAVFSPYKVSDTSRPGINFKRLDLGHEVANCSGEPRSIAFMDAYFHKVYVSEKRSP